MSVRLNLYAYHKKTKMEKLVDEMLALGVIRASTSPYSSPILLMREKDGG